MQFNAVYGINVKWGRPYAPFSKMQKWSLQFRGMRSVEPKMRTPDYIHSRPALTQKPILRTRTLPIYIHSTEQILYHTIYCAHIYIHDMLVTYMLYSTYKKF